MNMEVKHQLSKPVGNYKETQTYFGGYSRNPCCYKSHEHDSKNGYIKKAVHHLHISIKPVFNKNDKRCNEHGQQTNNYFKSFCGPDQVSFGSLPGTFFYPGFINIEHKQCA